MNVKDLVYSALFAVFIIIGSMIKVPIPIVPFTLQVLAVSTTALILSRKQATTAVLLYIILGLIGLPVFAGGKSGPAIFLSPTIGFILGFIPMAWVLNTLYHRLPKRKQWLAFIASELTLYIIALPLLYLNLRINVGVTLPLRTLFTSYFLMFLPTDALSMTLAYVITQKIPKTYFHHN